MWFQIKKLKAMYKTQFFKVGLNMLFFFLLFQFISLKFFEYDIFNIFGIYHYILFFGFFISLFIGLRLKLFDIYLMILVFQFLSVIGTYLFYNSYYHEPLGFEPSDEVFYDDFARRQQGNDFSDTLYELATTVGISDYGFPIVSSIVYSFGGNEIFNMKIFNLMIFLFSCILIFKTSILVSRDYFISRVVLLIFGLNPIAIYFNASGRKETFFIFIIVLCFYLTYKAIRGEHFYYYILAFISILLTGFFRTIFPIFILMAFGFTQMLNIKGHHRFLKLIGYLTLIFLFFGFTYMLIGSEISKEAEVDRGILVAARLGRAPGILDYFIMVISGLIGPFPSFKYINGNDSALLQTVGNFVKIFISYFFIMGSFLVFSRKLIFYYPMLFFVFLNMVLLVSVGAALDHRFIYPVIPVYIIIVVLGIDYVYRCNKMRCYIPYLVFTSVLVFAYNFR
jgi:hypothetical protein